MLQLDRGNFWCINNTADYTDLLQFVRFSRNCLALSSDSSLCNHKYFRICFIFMSNPECFAAILAYVITTYFLTIGRLSVTKAHTRLECSWFQNNIMVDHPIYACHLGFNISFNVVEYTLLLHLINIHEVYKFSILTAPN